MTLPFGKRKKDGPSWRVGVKRLRRSSGEKNYEKESYFEDEQGKLKDKGEGSAKAGSEGSQKNQSQSWCSGAE